MFFWHHFDAFCVKTEKDNGRLGRYSSCVINFLKLQIITLLYEKVPTGFRFSIMDNDPPR